MLAQFRRSAMGEHRRVGHAQTVADEFNLAKRRVRRLDLHAQMLDLRVVEHVVERVKR